MRLLLPLLLILFFQSCTSSKDAGSKDASKDSSTSEEKNAASEETVTVEGSVTKEDSGTFVDEIDVDDWSTFEAQNTAGTNLVLAQTESADDNLVTMYMLDKDSGGVHDFVSKSSVVLSEASTFSFKVLPNTYHIVKYKTLTGFVPALKNDLVLPLALNVESSVAVNIFIRILQTPAGKNLADAQKINADMLDTLAKKITSAGIGDLEAKLDRLVDPIIAEQQALDGDQNKSHAEIESIVDKIYSEAKIPANQRPTITAISDLSIDEDQTTGHVNFKISDPEGGLTGCSGGTVVATSSNQALITDATLATARSGTFPDCRLNLVPIADANGSATITVTVSDGALSSQEIFDLTVLPVNDSPTISSLSNLTIAENTSTGALYFTISDPDGALSSCGTGTVSVTSSNQSLVLNSSLIAGLSGTAPNCQLLFTPVTNADGASTITLTVNDGFLTAQSSFLLTVTASNNPPVITDIGDKSVDEDTSTGNIPFVVTYDDGALRSCAGTTITVTSSDQAIVSNASLAAGRLGAAPNCFLNFTPEPNANGSVVITVSASDGITSNQETFTLSVLPEDDPPVISAIADFSIAEDTTGQIDFTINDPDGPLTSCAGTTVSAISSNTDLVSNSSLSSGRSGTAPNCRISFLPATNANGSTTVMVTVSDGTLSSQRNVVVTVNPANDAPTAITLSTTSSVEGKPINSVFATLATTDPDAGDTFTYTLVSGTGSADNGSFNISGNSLRTSAVFDFSTKSQYLVRLRTTDQNALFFELPVVLSVTEAEPISLHVAYYDEAQVRLKYRKGLIGDWSAASEFLGADARPNIDGENIGLALDGNGIPHVSYFANGDTGDGRTALFRKPSSSWENHAIRASHSVNDDRSFAMARFVSNGLLQFISRSSGPESELYYFDPNLPIGSPAPVALPAALNRTDQSLRSCVDSQDRFWFAAGVNASETQLTIGYRKLGDSATYATMDVLPDVCQGDIISTGVDKVELLDMDCRNNKLTLLMACFPTTAGGATSYGYYVKDISAASPNMSVELEGFSLTALGLNLNTSAKVYGSVTRVSPETGNPHHDLRIALVGSYAGSHVHYFDGTSWIAASDNDGVVTGIAFGLDANNHPHIVYVVSETSDTVSHWYHDGTSGEIYGVLNSPNPNSIKLSPDLGISGSPGKSNH